MAIVIRPAILDDLIVRHRKGRASHLFRQKTCQKERFWQVFLFSTCMGKRLRARHIRIQGSPRPICGSHSLVRTRQAYSHEDSVLVACIENHQRIYSHSFAHRQKCSQGRKEQDSEVGQKHNRNIEQDVYIKESRQEWRDRKCS